MKQSNQNQRPLATPAATNGPEPELNESQRRDLNTHLLLLAWKRVLSSRNPKARSETLTRPGTGLGASEE